jgi:hypothetical protein
VPLAFERTLLGYERTQIRLRENGTGADLVWIRHREIFSVPSPAEG